MATKKTKAAPKKTAAKKAPAKKAVAKTVKKAAPAKKAAPKKDKPKAKRKPNAAFMAPLKPSAALAAIVGSNPLPRTEAVKKIWVYIKKHDLQDKKNKREIHCDDAMEGVFGAAKISMFDIAKAFKKHLH